MKRVYIAHPLLGDADRENPNLRIPFENRRKVDLICRDIIEAYPDVMPISPIHAFDFMNVFERERPLAMCLELLKMADELWVYGDWESSEGCKMEIARAGELGIPVKLKEETTMNKKTLKTDDGWVETKSKRLQVLLQPSLYEMVKQAAHNKRVSINEFIHAALLDLFIDEEEGKHGGNS